jgi:outer membrane protein assembly factor BamB
VGPDDSITIVGATVMAVPGAPEPHAGGTDAFVVRFDGDGNRVWAHHLGTPGLDTAYAVAATADGAVYVAGRAEGQLPGATAVAEHEAFLARYDAAGALTWVRQLRGSAAGEVVADAAGDAYAAVGPVVGASAAEPRGAVVTRFRADGSQVWTTEPVDGVAVGQTSLAVAGDAVWFGGSSGDPMSAWLGLLRLDGTVAWVRQYGASNEGITDVAADGHGGVLAGGVAIGPSDLEDDDGFVARFDVDGNLLWRRPVDTVRSDHVRALATDPEGRLYVVGSTTGDLAHPDDPTPRVRSFVLRPGW